MKKKLLALAVISSILLSGCGNKQILDTKWTFTTAKIIIGNETLEVNVKSWKDFKDDTSVQIVTDNGKVYLTDIKNVLLISK